MIKVLCFDGWTGGVHHFLRLIDAFKKNGMSLSLVHLGSWEGGDVQKEQVIGGLIIKDIAYYQKQDLHFVLKEELPDVVIFLSTNTIAHRSMLRYCNLMSIPTVQIFPGLLGVLKIDGSSYYKQNLVGHLGSLLRRIPKLLQRSLPQYILSLCRTNSTYKEWIYLLKELSFGAVGRLPIIFGEDSRASKCCVYSRSEICIATIKYGYEKSDVIEVGIPDLISFGFNLGNLAFYLNRQESSSNKHIMYIDTGLIYIGNAFRSPMEFVNHIVNTRDSLALQGIALLFKPKPQPGPIYDEMIKNLTKHRIVICSKEGFIGDLMSCCACITEPSTLALLPALMGMPIFLADYSSLNGQVYGKLLTGYPRSIFLSDVDKVTISLQDEQSKMDASVITRWINDNSGPLPASEMPSRVAKVVKELVN